MISGGPPGPPWSGESLPGKGPDRRKPQAVDCVRMVHARRKLFELAAVAKAPIAAEAVRRIDELFTIERTINGLSAEKRLAIRHERTAPILAELESWLRL